MAGDGRSVQRWLLPRENRLRRRRTLEPRFDTLNPYAGAAVTLDGETVETGQVRRKRDGGTTEIRFRIADEDHCLILHRRLQSERYESLDGHRLERTDP